MCGNGRKCFMKGGIRVPVCVIGEAVRPAAASLVMIVRNIRRISLHWQKAMVQKESVLFVRVKHCSDADITELFRISKVFGAAIIDYDGAAVLLECTQTENRNDDLIALLKRKFVNRIEIVRGGSVAAEAVSISER